MAVIATAAIATNAKIDMGVTTEAHNEAMATGALTAVVKTAKIAAPQLMDVIRDQGGRGGRGRGDKGGRGGEPTKPSRSDGDWGRGGASTATASTEDKKTKKPPKAEKDITKAAMFKPAAASTKVVNAFSLLNDSDSDYMSNERQKGVVVSKAIAYGSVATYLGRKSEETKTHRWHIYVRGIANEDLSYMISKVVISLHSSFANPVRGITTTRHTEHGARSIAFSISADTFPDLVPDGSLNPSSFVVLTEPPYEVSEYGWGEFETRIQIHFQDPDEKPVDKIHMLVLYPPGNQIASTKKPVVSEFYDELVFNEPTEFMYKKLMTGTVLHPLTPCPDRMRFLNLACFKLDHDTGPEKQAPPNPLQEYWPVYSEAQDLKLLADANAFISRELAMVKALLVEADIEAKEVKEKLQQLQAQVVPKKSSKPPALGYP
ncbi:hypothetical protein DYB32_003769 [Aphanomyces invadans]|uniref:YEATS domain-containing protein n=1 Tax=Aphanomyces invadans TaxID=157072 RepID=A0A418AZG2_9STRA|nr:hypothetical protein DYB32_003769 [Aphanomyces invadans]